MTIDSDAFAALIASVPHAVRVRGPEAPRFDPALRPETLEPVAAPADADSAGDGAPSRKGVFYIVDMMALGEPSEASCGRLTKARLAELELRLGRAPTDAECAAEAGPPQTWADYAEARVRAARWRESAPGVAGTACYVDVGTHPGKYLEHWRRYGVDDADADEEGTARVDAGSGIDVRPCAAAKKAASDAEVADALARPTLPPNWKECRANSTFTRAVSRIICAAVTARAPPAGKCLIVAGDPRIDAKTRHTPIMYRAGGAPQLLATADFDLRYDEADFSVVHMAVMLEREGFDTVTEVVDGDTVMARVLEAPRSSTCALAALARDAARAAGNEAEAERLEAEVSRLAALPVAWNTRAFILRRVQGTTMLIDVHAFYRGLMAPRGIAAFAGPTPRARHGVAYAVAVAMLLGNDYALKFMPGTGFKTLQRVIIENASELAGLVSGASAGRLAADKRAQHELRVDRTLLHSLVEKLYATKARAPKRPSANAVNVAHAVLEWTLNYFANASNPHVAPVDVYARGGPENLSLHGFELIDPTQPPSRTNVRVALRVHIPSL